MCLTALPYGRTLFAVSLLISVAAMALPGEHDLGDIVERGESFRQKTGIRVSCDFVEYEESAAKTLPDLGSRFRGEGCHR